MTKTEKTALAAAIGGIAAATVGYMYDKKIQKDYPSGYKQAYPDGDSYTLTSAVAGAVGGGAGYAVGGAIGAAIGAALALAGNYEMSGLSKVNY